MANVEGYLKLVMGLTQSVTANNSMAKQTIEQLTFPILNGTTAGKMDLLYSKTATLAASASEELDLRGALTDALGQTCVFVDVRMICVIASAGNTNDVLVGGAAANAFVNWVGNSSDIVVVKPGGCLFLYTPTDAGYAVTAGTADLLKIANSGGATGVTYTIYIGGVSA